MYEINDIYFYCTKYLFSTKKKENTDFNCEGSLKTFSWDWRSTLNAETSSFLGVFTVNTKIL